MDKQQVSTLAIALVCRLLKFGLAAFVLVGLSALASGLGNWDEKGSCSTLMADDQMSLNRATELEATNLPQPNWIGQPSKRVGAVFQTVVTSDPYTTKEECDAALDSQLVQATDRYVDELLGPQAHRLVPVDIGTIRHAVCREEYVETLDTSVGPMRRVHVLLAFDERLRDSLRDRYRSAVQHRRVSQAGGGALAVLLVLATLFGYLKLDTATRGFYTRRLQVVATVVILAVVVLGLQWVQTPVP